MKLTFPPSMFGARCDMLMDIVVMSMLIILPLLWYSYVKVRRDRAFGRHRTIQLYLFVVLFFVVLLFEYDMQQHGGIFEMVKGSSYEGTFFLNFTIYFHVFLSITTSLIWIVLIILSLRKFGNPPRPNAFSKTHKLWGRIGMWDMALTCITGLMLYVFGFIL
jgi:putative membrane protein